MPSALSKPTKSPIFWGVVLILVYAPYQRGLFFEREWLYTLVFTALLLVLALFSRRQYLSMHYHKVDWVVLGFLLAYGISALTAVNAGAAVVEVLKILDLSGVYWLLAHGGWSKRDARVVLEAVFWAGLGVALLGIGAALGLVQVDGGYVDGRIYSTLQYPNTLAAYLGMVFLLGVYLWQSTKALLRHVYPAALCLVIICLVGTGSRGGIGVFLLVLPVALWLQPVPVRREFAVKTILSLCVGGLEAWGFLQYLTVNPTFAKLALLAGVVLSCGLGAAGNRLIRLPGRKLLLVILLVIVALGVIFTLRSGTGNPLHRLETANLQQHSFQERLTYYKDGLRMMLARPVQGFGGGGWAMYPRYQSYPYRVSDPHSQLIKVGVESGGLGLLFYLLWWIVLLQLARRRAKQGDAGAAVMLGCLLLLGAHSLMDFDLSFGAMQLLLWALTGLLAAGGVDAEPSLSNPLVKYTSMGVIAVTALILAGMGISLLQASEQEGWGTFYVTQNNPAAALQHLQTARKKDAFSAGFPVAMAELYLNSNQVYDLAKAQAAVDTALKLNSTDPSIKDLASRILLARGQLKQAAALAEDQLSFQSLQEQAYLQLADFYQQLASKALAQGQTAEARSFLLQGAQLAERFQERLNQVPPREAGLWVGGKPKVSSRLRQTCAVLTSEAAKLP